MRCHISSQRRGEILVVVDRECRLWTAGGGGPAFGRRGRVDDSNSFTHRCNLQPRAAFTPYKHVIRYQTSDVYDSYTAVFHSTLWNLIRGVAEAQGVANDANSEAKSVYKALPHNTTLHYATLPHTTGEGGIHISLGAPPPPPPPSPPNP